MGLLIVPLNEVFSLKISGANGNSDRAGTVVVIVFSKKVLSFDLFIWDLQFGYFEIGQSSQ